MLDLALDGKVEGWASISTACRDRRSRRGGHARTLPDPRHPVPRPLAAFRRRRRPRCRTATPTRARPRRLRPRHSLGAARRRRRAGLALCRSAQRRDIQPLRRSGGRQPAHGRGRRSRRSRPALETESAGAAASRFPEDNPLRRPRRPRRLAPPPRRANAGAARPVRGRAPRRALRHSRGARGRRPAARPGDPRIAARGARPDLGRPAGDRRRSPRRLLAPSGDPARRRQRRAGAAAQALAMAGLFADRAAAGGRHRGDRHRRPHRPRRISQWRPVRGHGRAPPRRPGRRGRGRTMSPTR